MRRGPGLALAAAALLACGCASLLPTRTVLESMDEADVDVVVAKTIERYPQVARVLVSESFVIALDSVIVPHSPLSPGGRGKEDGGPPPGGVPSDKGGWTAATWTTDEARLVTAIASHMLGEEVGRDWVNRAGRERMVLGEGQVAILVYRDTAGKDGAPRYLLDASGLFALFFPLASSGKTTAIEALSFDLKVANQHIAIAPEGGAVDVYGEILPRSGSYSEGGTVFRRWAGALFHLGWSGNDGKPPAPAAAGPDLAPFLQNARAYVGPLVRLRVRFERGADGYHRVALGVPNEIEVVLPNALVAGDRGLEAAVERLSALLPGRFVRKGEDLFVRVGYFFFHPESTGPGAPEPGRRDATRDLKKFRIPDGK